MRNFVKLFVLSCTFLLVCGCLSPSTLRPVATDNATNLTNYTANVDTLLGMYADVLGPLLEMRYALIQGTLRDAITKYTKSATMNETSFKRDVADLRPLAQQIMSLQDSPERKATVAEQLRKKPIIADVAFNRIDENAAIILLKNYIEIGQKGAEYENVMLNDVFSPRFFVTSDALSLNKEIRGAYADFVKLVGKQGQLGIQHSKAILEFSNSNASFGAAVSLLTSDSIQKTVAELVAVRTGDPVRKEAAQAALKELTNIRK
ncbi:MAG: hypothetical protein V1766_02230 [Pseudomonadota bacterium]